MQIAFKPRRPVPNLLGFLSIPPISIGGPPIAIPTPRSSSNGCWSFMSSDNTTLNMHGNTAVAVSPGPVTITVTQGSKGIFEIGRMTTGFIVNPVHIAGMGPLVIPKKFKTDPPFGLVKPMSVSSGNFSFSSSDASIVSITGSIATIREVGTCTIYAKQAATGNYVEGTVSYTLIISLATPTLGPLFIPDVEFGKPDFQLTPPTSNSSGSWTFVSSDASVLSVTGRTVAVKKVGSCTITARQAPTVDYADAKASTVVSVVQTSTTLGAFSIPISLVRGAPFQLTPPASNSSGSWTFTSSNPAILSIVGSTASIGLEGSCLVTAIQAESVGYISMSVQALAIVRTPLVPTIGAILIPTLYVDPNNGPGICVLGDPQSNSGGAFSYSSSDPFVMTVVGMVVTAVGVGTCTITVSQAANGSYVGASVTVPGTVLA